MRVIYNLNGTIDLLATRELALGNPSEEELEEELEPVTQRAPSNPVQSAYQEFWADPCWAESPGHLG